MDSNQQNLTANPVAADATTSNPNVIRLIIVFIIGLVLVITIAAAYISSGVYARDRIRVKDVQLIEKFLEAYKNNTGTYPASANSQAVGYEQYLAFYPKPPTPESNCTTDQNNYKYLPLNERTSYQLSFCLGKASSGYKAGFNIVQP